MSRPSPSHAASLLMPLSPSNSPAVPSGPMQPAASRDYTAGKPANGDAGALPRAGTVPGDAGKANAYLFPSLGSHQIVLQIVQSLGRKDMKILLQMEKEAAELQSCMSHLPPSLISTQPALPLNVQPNSNKTTTRMSPVMVAYFHAYPVHRCRLGLPTYWPK